jgi:hypothetical protein
MALGSTQPLTEMSTRNLPGSKGRPVRKADNLTAICGPTVYKMWEPRRLTTLCAFTAFYRDTFNFFFNLDGHILGNSNYHVQKLYSVCGTCAMRGTLCPKRNGR